MALDHDSQTQSPGKEEWQAFLLRGALCPVRRATGYSVEHMLLDSAIILEFHQWKPNIYFFSFQQCSFQSSCFLMIMGFWRHWGIFGN